ncbi:MAG TPA: beta-ketoacyl synthase N-terminal-like domain-containing protein, partial [Polyangiaceae bacterium]|nr:beta-ketoacyl synthase N-terminal-like domain-containing protein [Polyangiaceae bacterium]
WSSRAAGKPFARVTACEEARAERPRALLALGLAQVVEQLDQGRPGWRGSRLGVVIGTSSGGLPALERAMGEGAEVWEKSGYFSALSAVEPTLGRAPERLVSLYAACASSTLAIGLGLRWLELGEAELVIVGGYDAESDWVCAGFDALKATSAAYPRPFRAERDGMALGEGVALLALAPDANKAFGFVRGFAATTDGVHITAPDRTGRSLARAARLALTEAELTPQQIGFVSAHGTGTAFNDAAEAAALGLVFDSLAKPPALHAFKPLVGHTLGAAGALEALAALSALEQGVLPASLSPGTDMPELGARLLARNEAAPVEHCLKLSTAFGGANAALVLSRSHAPAVTRVARPVHVATVGALCSELELGRVESLLVAPVARLPRSDELSSLAVAASAEALRGGVSLDRARIGVVVGSATSSLEACADFSSRILERGPEQAEPRRFPATSPNACAGHVAIAFGLGGPSHAVGAGGGAAFEALEVACDWLSAGDADAMLVVVAEHSGPTANRVLAAAGLRQASSVAVALLLTSEPSGPRLDRALARATAAKSAVDGGIYGLLAWAHAAGLPGAEAFGSVRPPE